MLSVFKNTTITVGLVFLLAACAPEIGSKAWCEDMNEMPKGEWTANQAADYARHCLINQ